MELRTYNVTKVYFRCVRVTIGDEIGVNKDKVQEHLVDIKSMVEQLPKGVPMKECHIRTDGEQWTPYLQVVTMIVLLGIHIGVLKKKPISPDMILETN